MSASQPRFQRGDQVVVRRHSPPGHFRTPGYIQGKVGRVDSLCGVFRNPESLGHGGSGLPAQPLYRVEFLQGQVWPNYRGPPSDKVLVDLYEHWLEPVFEKEAR